MGVAVALGDGVRVGAVVLVAVGLDFVAVGATFVVVMTVFAAVGASGLTVDAGAHAEIIQKMNKIEINFINFMGLSDHNLPKIHPLPQLPAQFSPQSTTPAGPAHARFSTHHRRSYRIIYSLGKQFLRIR